MLSAKLIRWNMLIVAVLSASIAAGAAAKKDKDAQPPEVKIVIAEGRSAAQNRDRAFDDAKNDALREAVNQASGVWVDSETLTKNFKLVADIVHTKSTALIRSYKILSESRQDDLLVVKIRAEVVMGALKKELVEAGIIIEITGHQRLMVIGVELVDDKLVAGNFAGQPLEAALLEKGFDLVDREQIDAVKAADAAVNFDNPAKAAALGNRLGAEIVVSYKAVTTYAGPQEQYGVVSHLSTAEITVKIIKADTGAVRESFAANGRIGSMSRSSSANQSLQKAGKTAAPKVVAGVIEALKREFQGEGADLQLIVSGISFSDMGKLKKALANIRDVQSVGSPVMKNQLATYRLKARMQAETLAQRLTDLKDFPLEITGLDQNRVEAEWKPK